MSQVPSSELELESGIFLSSSQFSVPYSPLPRGIAAQRQQSILQTSTQKAPLTNSPRI